MNTLGRGLDLCFVAEDFRVCHVTTALFEAIVVVPFNEVLQNGGKFT